MIIQALLSYCQPYADNTPHITINAPIIKQKLVQIENFRASNNESSILKYNDKIFAFSWYKKLPDGKCVAIKSLDNVNSFVDSLKIYTPTQFAQRYPNGITEAEIKEAEIKENIYTGIFLFVEVKPTELRYERILESPIANVI